MNTYAIAAEKFFLPGHEAQGGFLLIEDAQFGEWSATAPEGVDIRDYSGAWIAPGMVDTHIHGFYGHATTDCDAEGLVEASRELARRGTTSWLPTTFTESVESIDAACAAIAQAADLEDADESDQACAHIAGIYLEGPFFTEKHVGAQNPAYLIDPDVAIFERWQESADGLIVKSALAPEREGATAYIAALNQLGVATCIGHSDATYDQALAAVRAGATCFVHTYNGQRGLHHREPGIVGCAMTTPDTYAEIICDGRHVHPAAIAALVRAKGWQHSVLITDCLGCGGLPEGHYMSGGLPVVMEGGLCYLENEDGTKGNIAGSVLTLAQGVKNIVDWGIASPAEAIAMATEVPARSALIDDYCGSIRPRRSADFVVFDSKLNLQETYVGGMSASN